MAFLTATSVLLRWTTSQPVRGDVELVQLGGGIAVVGFLAYGTLMRTNIMVDSFTGWLPARLRRAVDAFWNLIWGVVALVLAERLAIGAIEAHASRTTTIGLLGVPIWWAVGLAAVGFAMTGIAAMYWVRRLLRGRE